MNAAHKTLRSRVSMRELRDKRGANGYDELTGAAFKDAARKRLGIGTPAVQAKGGE